jgi:hypothetical protein
VLSLSTARAALAIVCAGLLTFVVTYALLEAVWTHAAAEPANVAPTPVVAAAPDSLAPQIAAGDIGVGLPTAGADALLHDVRAGDRLNVLASVTGGDGRPVTAVVVSGAKVLQPASGDSPLVVEVSAADGLALAHLVLGGTHLSYAVVPAGATPAPSAPMDAAQARARLGLSGAATPAPTAPVATSAPTAAPTPQPAPSQPQPQPTATPGPSGGYTVQPGDTLESIAAHLDVDPGALWWANRAVLDAGPLAGPLEPGMQLAIPSVRGFLYQVQPGDSWDSIGGTFNLPGTILRALNQPSGSDPPAPGSLVFIPQP